MWCYGSVCSVTALILNVQICTLTGVEPGSGLDGMYVIADIFAVAFIMFTFLLRCMREGGDDDDDEDEQVVEINETYGTQRMKELMMHAVHYAPCSNHRTPEKLSQ
jgi:hypothetical protein